MEQQPQAVKQQSSPLGKNTPEQRSKIAELQPQAMQQHGGQPGDVIENLGLNKVGQTAPLQQQPTAQAQKLQQPSHPLSSSSSSSESSSSSSSSSSTKNEELQNPELRKLLQELVKARQQYVEAWNQGQDSQRINQLADDFDRCKTNASKRAYALIDQLREEYHNAAKAWEEAKHSTEANKEQLLGERKQKLERLSGSLEWAKERLETILAATLELTQEERKQKKLHKLQQENPELQNLPPASQAGLAQQQ
ncbi:hypothetical protein QOT17_005820 [Balamuthia mandrillaris]